MKSRRTHARRALSFECLETRLPLAGNVTINIGGGNLTVTGDGESNSISIVQTGPGTFTISGNDGEIFKQKGQADTEDAVEVEGITKNMTVNLKGGDDLLEIEGEGIDVLLANNLSIKMGAGDDSVDVNDGKLTGKMTIDTGKANTFKEEGELFIGMDIVRVDSVRVLGKSANINTKNGNDEVTVSNFFAVNSTIKTGAADDSVDVQDAQFTGKLTINTGKATSFKEEGEVFAGTEMVNLNSVVVQGKTATITTGNGDDSVTVSNFTGHRATIKTGAGFDSVSVADVTVDSAQVTLGGGDDEFSLDGPLVLRGPKKSTVIGGKGENSLGGDLANLSPASQALVDISGFDL